MVKIFTFWLFAFLYINIYGSEAERLDCINRLKVAFELQSRAKTYLDSYNNCILFNSAQERLEKIGEPKCRTEAIRSLWIWYRIYGFNYGLIENPVQCPDEYIANRRSRKSSRSILGYQTPNSQVNGYDSLDPKQQESMRTFLIAVGAVVSGVFCVAVNPPVMGKLGLPLIGWGFNSMWDALNPMITERKEKELRQKELVFIQEKAEQASKSTN